MTINNIDLLIEAIDNYDPTDSASLRDAIERVVPYPLASILLLRCEEGGGYRRLIRDWAECTMDVITMCSIPNFDRLHQHDLHLQAIETVN